MTELSIKQNFRYFRDEFGRGVHPGGRGAGVQDADPERVRRPALLDRDPLPHLRVNVPDVLVRLAGLKVGQRRGGPQWAGGVCQSPHAGSQL